FNAAQQPFLLAPFALLALGGYLGLYWGAWAGWLVFLRRRGQAGTLFALGGAAGWEVLEYVRTHLFSGFPWTLLGDSQVHRLPLIQIASITGVYGVSFLIVWGNLALAEAYQGARR